MLISQAPAGMRFSVVKVLLSKERGRRLADMGFTLGARGCVVRAAFLKGPLHLRIRGYDILIRRDEAAGIEIEALPDGAEG
jgi:Fe2+ transport system protein FeoA